MEAKKYLYAAVGAPLVVAKQAQERVGELRAKLTEDAQSLGKDLQEQFETWAGEGERLMSRLTEGKMIDDFAAKVDFDQMQEQVSKLRDQLEDLLATWRSSFRPAERRAAVPAVEEKPEAVPPKAAARKTAATKKRPPAKKAPAKKAPAGKAAQGARKTTEAAKAS